MNDQHNKSAQNEAAAARWRRRATVPKSDMAQSTKCDAAAKCAKRIFNGDWITEEELAEAIRKAVRPGVSKSETVLEGQMINKIQIAVWCPHCKRRHVHGFGGGIDEISHRVAHCDPDSPYFKYGYYIKLKST